MSVWYDLNPLDTLFFRGSEPMEAGQLTAKALFPPPVSVVEGALRTAVLVRAKVGFEDYKQGRVPDEVLDRVGPCSQEAPFRVVGLLFRKNDRIYAPAPASWFVDMEMKPMLGEDLVGQKVRMARCLPKSSPLGLVVSAEAPPIMEARHQPVPLAGNWVALELLSIREPKIGADDMLMPGDLFDLESRVGIALDANRKVLEGKLYSAGHIRLRPDVTLLVGLDRDIGIGDSGRLTLGGELRVCGYERCKTPSFPTVEGDRFLTLVPVPLESETLGMIVSAPKPVILAGWDLARRFHKPTRSWLPAGSVFSMKINTGCVPLAG